MGTANIPAYVSLSYTCHAIVVRIPTVKACSAMGLQEDYKWKSQIFRFQKSCQ